MTQPDKPEQEITLVADDSRARLDAWLAARLPERSRAEVQRWIKQGRVRLAGAPLKASYRLLPGDVIAVSIPAAQPSDLAPEALPLDIVYEDADLLVINKAPGQVVHPAPGHRSGTLVNAILHHVPDLAGIGGTLRPGIVHRLDKDTSGLLLVAKNDTALRALQRQFKERRVHKVYLALVYGTLRPREGTIDAPVGRDPRQRQRMAVLSGQTGKAGRPALTHYRVQTYYQDATLVEAEPMTGRTHQIRVHFQFIGFPLVGDRVYGPRKARIPCPRHFLHARTLGFYLPSDMQYVEFEAPLPADLQAVLAQRASYG